MSPPHRTRPRGFTLVELIVVLGVIVFLTALVLSVGSAVVQRSAGRETESTLRLLDLALQEWELHADRKLTWWDRSDDPAAYESRDIHGDTADFLIISELLLIIDRVPSARQILAQIDPDFLYRYEEGVYPRWIDNPAAQYQQDGRFTGALTVTDAWGWAIYATHPGRVWTGGDLSDLGEADEDGTIRTPNEQTYGVTRDRRVCFVSAGPDRDFGVMSAAPHSDEFARARDNLYSYDVVRPVGDRR